MNEQQYPPKLSSGKSEAAQVLGISTDGGTPIDRHIGVMPMRQELTEAKLGRPLNKEEILNLKRGDSPEDIANAARSKRVVAIGRARVTRQPPGKHRAAS